MVRFTFSHCSVIIANRCICMVLSQQQQKHSVTSNTTQRKFVWKSLDTKRLSGSDDIWTNMDREVWWFQHMPPQPPSPFCYRGIITAQTCTTKKQSQKVFAMCSLIPQDSTVIPHWSAQLLNSTDKFNFLTWSVNIQKVFPRYVIPTQNCIFRCRKLLKPMWNPALFPVLDMQFLMFTKDLELTVADISPHRIRIQMESFTSSGYSMVTSPSSF